MVYTQDNRAIAIDTPLGRDVLLLQSFRVEEGISRLPRFSLELLSVNPALTFSSIVGKAVTIRMRMPDESESYFHGIVSRFSQGGGTFGLAALARYHAEVMPWTWLLTQIFDCRIFQNLTVPEIIEKVFASRGMADYRMNVQGSYPKLTYCVQYRESDFNFISRLMEQWGIFYYFEHEQSVHRMVLADAAAAHQMCPMQHVARYQATHGAAVLTEDVITRFTVEHQVCPDKVALTDYNFETPSANLRVQDSGTRTAPSTCEVYDYPGLYMQRPVGEFLARRHIEAEEASSVSIAGAGTCRSFRTGYVFTLTDHYRSDLNQDYLITSLTHAASEGAYEAGISDSLMSYENEFTCIPRSVPFRPPRKTPKPLVHGTQTAVVVGKAGEEIWVDKYGRIKVQFHWDRLGNKDENSSCWIRVAQNWAGKRWGAAFLPRIGQEVVVAFLEGDPDQPLVVGSVYNAEQTVPYELPANQTRSTVKSNTSKGGDGFNEIRFEDKQNKEQIFVHAERNMDVRVKASEMESVGGSRHLTVGGVDDHGVKSGDQMEMVYRDKHLKVHRNRTEHIGGSAQVMVGGIDGGPGNHDAVIKGKKRELVEGESHLHVKAARKEKVDGDQSLRVGGKQNEWVATKHALETGQEIHLKAGIKVVIEAMQQVTIKSPGGFIDIGVSGVTIQGAIVKINSGGSAASGSGSNPETPEDAAEASPTEPSGADNARTGAVSRP